MSEVIRVIVKGRVQGVGFRMYTQHLAHRLEVPGWVRNLPGGEVEVLAQVSPATKSRFLAGLQQGPPMSRVDGLDVQPAPPGEAPGDGFRVRH